MKQSTFLIAILFTVITGHAQTVENIRVVQDGDNLNITYRIGASTDAQLYNVYLSCSMDGRARFEPKAVIGDVGENISGGKSFNTIIWDVFQDVDEVVNPEFFVRVELVSDASAAAAAAATRSQETAKQQETTKEETTTSHPDPFEPGFEVEESEEAVRFKRNGFFSLVDNPGFGFPVLGLSFGSLNNFGYYVTPIRFGLDMYYLSGVNEGVDHMEIMATAGLTKYIVAAGIYRLHGFGGIGAHRSGRALYSNDYYVVDTHAVLETGVINVLGGFNLTLGISIHPGHIYPTHLLLAAGFVF